MKEKVETPAVTLGASLTAVSVGSLMLVEGAETLWNLPVPCQRQPC